MRDGDGNVVINVTADDKQAQKRLDSLNRSIVKLEQNIKSTESARLPITEQLREAQQAAIETYNRIEELKKNIALSEEQTGLKGNLSPDEWLAEVEAQKQLKAELAEQEKLLAQQEKTAQRLEAQDEKLLKTMEQQTQQLETQKQEAGELTAQLSGKGDESVSESVKSSADGFKKGLKNILKWGIGIRSLYVLVNKLRAYIKEAVNAFAAEDPATKAAMKELKANLAALKASWGAAFAPIVTAVIPVLNTLVQWLTTAANAVANFFAVLGGKATYKKAVANAENLAGYLDDAASAAGAAKKELMGIDELNVLSSNSGGSSSSTGYDWIDEVTNTETLSGRIGMVVSDFFTNWKNLNSEQVATKVFAGAYALGGAILGFMVGGVPGLLVGGALGLSLGLAQDAIMFDGDGSLSKTELTNMIYALLVPLITTCIGLLFGPAGAAIGFIIGCTISLALNYKKQESDDGSKEQATDEINSDIDDIAEKSEKHAKEKGKSIGDYLRAGLAIAYEESSPEAQSTIKKVVGFFAKIPDLVKDVLGIHSPSTVFADIGRNMIQGLIDGFSERWNTFISNMQSKWQNFKAWWNSLSLGRINIKLPHIEVSSRAVDSTIAKFLGIKSVPQLSIRWYARGGIVDGATLIGAGEAGKEAIVPLERNTQWVQMVAKELASMLFDASIFNSIGAKLTEIASAIDRLTQAMQQPLPAVATGMVVPPNMASTDVMDRLASLLSRLDNGESVVPIEVTSKVYLDKREIGEAVTKYQAERGRARG